MFDLNEYKIVYDHTDNNSIITALATGYTLDTLSKGVEYARAVDNPTGDNLIYSRINAPGLVTWSPIDYITPVPSIAPGLITLRDTMESSIININSVPEWDYYLWTSDMCNRMIMSNSKPVFTDNSGYISSGMDLVSISRDVNARVCSLEKKQYHMDIQGYKSTHVYKIVHEPIEYWHWYERVSRVYGHNLILVDGGITPIYRVVSKNADLVANMSTSIFDSGLGQPTIGSSNLVGLY